MIAHLQNLSQNPLRTCVTLAQKPMVLILAIALLSIPLHPTQAQPNPSWPNPSRSTAQSTPSPLRYTPPPDRGTPPSNKTTGSRGDCLYPGDRPSLSPLVGQSHLSQTLSTHPTLWFYNPYTEVSSVELILIAEATDQEIYRHRLTYRSEPGVLGIQLPQTLAPLQPNQDYRWYIDLNCQTPGATGRASSTPATLTGIIQPIHPSPELVQELSRATPMEAIALYGQNHLWYDMLTALARQRLENLGDRQLQELWQTLLQDEANVGLAFLSEEPLIGEVVSEQ